MGLSMPVDALRVLRASNVAAVTAAVSRRVLPLIYDQALAASGVVEEERGHRARTRIAVAREMTVDEAGSSARGARHSRHAGGIRRDLRRTWRKGDDEVAMHTACNTVLYGALRSC